MINLESLSNNPVVQRKMLMQAKRAQALQAWNETRKSEPIQESFTELSDPIKERKRQKQLERNRKMAEKSYLSEASVTALTALMTVLVESSVMYDLDEFKTIYPMIHEEIKGTVKSFVQNAGINTDLENKNTRKLIECVAKVTSSDKILTEEEIETLVTQYITPESDIDKAINDLQYDTTEKVAELVQADVDRIAEIDDEVAKIEAIAHPEEEEVVTESIVFENNASGIQIKNDVNKTKKINAPVLIKEHYCEGLLEALAVKEGMALLEAGKEYNSDIALGKALTYLTILEAFNATGLMEMGPNDYSKIAQMAGAGKKMFRTVRTPKVINEDIEEIEMKENDIVYDEIKTNDTEFDFPEVSREANIDNYAEDKRLGIGVASQVDDLSEEQLQAILNQKYGYLPEYRSLFEMGVSAGYVRMPNGRWQKIS